MKDRLKIIINENNLKQYVFAEKIGVSKAVVSQWLSGRQKPKFEHIEKILEEFPRYNRYWLLNASEPKYLSEITNNNLQATLFDENNTANGNDKNKNIIVEAISQANITENIQNTKEIESQKTLATPPITTEIESKSNKEKNKEKKNIKKIVFFYSDNSFEVYEN